MPVVVNELVFRAEIAAPSSKPTPDAPRPLPAAETKLLVELCVEEVLRVLAQRQER